LLQQRFGMAPQDDDFSAFSVVDVLRV